jgi:hypothetical protein
VRLWLVFPCAPSFFPIASSLTPMGGVSVIASSVLMASDSRGRYGWG